MTLIKGCYTAIITPFDKKGVDEKGLEMLIEFQVSQGVDAILSTGTTGESPVLNHPTHVMVVRKTANFLNGRIPLLVGTGSNSTDETIYLTGMIQDVQGLIGILLVDPYYNGPSSWEILKEYVEPVARIFSDLEVVPYIIPGRTGAQLYSEDLAMAAELKNVNAVKEATGSLENMKKTRQKCGKDFLILSGDDGLTFQMMSDPDIAAGGVISVMSNIFPGPMSQMIKLLNDGQVDEAKKIHEALKPMFDVVTVKTFEDHGYGIREVRARNPLAVKTLMNILGMPAGPCWRPLGKMTRMGFSKVLDAIRTIQKNSPKLLEPVADFFNVDIEERIGHNHPWWHDDLIY